MRRIEFSAYRMSQTNTVVVHRLLTDNSIDERMMEMLDSKEQIFDSYARDSVMAESSTQAVDITEKSLKERILSQEQKRLGLAGNQATGEEAATTSEAEVTVDTRESGVTEVVSDTRKPSEAEAIVHARKPEAPAVKTSPEMIIPTNFCAYCGSRLKPDALFCTGCGKKVD